MIKKRQNALFKEAPEDTVPPFMRIRQYVASLLVQAKGDNVKLLSERELSSMFNVTRPTVRKALKQLIDEGELIIKPGLGTFINPLRIQNCRSQIKNRLKISIIHGNGRLTHWDSYFWGMLQECGNTLTKNNALIHFLNIAYNGAKAGNEILMYQPDGVIWISPPDDCIEALAMLKDRRIPVILINQGFPDLKISSVRIDYDNLGFIAGHYLAKTNLERILYVAKRSSWSYNEIYNGFKRAFHEVGKQFNEKFVLDGDDDIYQEVTHFLHYGDGFDAVFSLSTYFNAVCQAIQDSGIDLSNLLVLTQENPSLSSYPNLKPVLIKEPLAEVGQIAAEKLLVEIKNSEEKTSNTLLKPELLSKNT